MATAPDPLSIQPTLNNALHQDHQDRRMLNDDEIIAQRIAVNAPRAVDMVLDENQIARNAFELRRLTRDHLVQLCVQYLATEIKTAADATSSKILGLVNELLPRVASLLPDSGKIST